MEIEFQILLGIIGSVVIAGASYLMARLFRVNKDKEVCDHITDAMLNKSLLEQQWYDLEQKRTELVAQQRQISEVLGKQDTTSLDILTPSARNLSSDTLDSKTGHEYEQ